MLQSAATVDARTRARAHAHTRARACAPVLTPQQFNFNTTKFYFNIGDSNTSDVKNLLIKPARSQMSNTLSNVYHRIAYHSNRNCDSSPLPARG